MCKLYHLIYGMLCRTQLDLITNLLGTPKQSDMRTAAEGAVKHMKQQPHKPARMSTLYTLSQDATHEAIHLICQMLVFDPVSETTVDTAQFC